MAQAQTINIPLGDGIAIKRKVKFIIHHNNEHISCISALHASQVLKQRGSNLSQADCYNWADARRGKKRLIPRWPQGLVLEIIGVSREAADVADVPMDESQ